MSVPSAAQSVRPQFGGTRSSASSALCALRHGFPGIMGIINATPDSFSDGATALSLAAALRRAAEHVKAGASVLDIGGESTRPGASAVSADEQKRRVLPIVEAIVAEGFSVALSIDTSDANVALAAIERGVTLVNDVTGLRSDTMAHVVASTGVQAVVMHLRGTPQTMQSAEHCTYQDVVSGVIDELQTRLLQACARGVGMHQLWVDPGIGFAKTAAQSWQLVRHLDALDVLGCPIVIGASRKSFLTTAIAGGAQSRDAATAAVCSAAVVAGAKLLRVHNVAAVKDAVGVGWALRQAALQRSEKIGALP